MKTLGFCDASAFQLKAPVQLKMPLGRKVSIQRLKKQVMENLQLGEGPPCAPLAREAAPNRTRRGGCPRSVFLIFDIFSGARGSVLGPIWGPCGTHLGYIWARKSYLSCWKSYLSDRTAAQSLIYRSGPYSQNYTVRSASKIRAPSSQGNRDLRTNQKGTLSEAR